MTPLVIALADAVVAELNGRTWSLPFEAVRRVLPEYEPKDYATLRVTVVPRSQECAPLSRREMRRDITIDVAIQQRLSGDPDAALPARAALVDEFLRHFLGRRLAEPAAVCSGATNPLLYSIEHLRELRMLTTVVSLSFQASDPMAEAAEKPPEEPEP